jgi:hypothetical protein
MRFISWIFAAAVALPLAPAAAEPLDAERCSSLKAEQSQLEQAGVRDNLQRGAAWGKANLSAAKLEEVRHLIEVDEQVLFRCGSKALVNLPPDEPEPAAKADDKPAGKTEAKPDAAAPGGKEETKAKVPAAPAKKAHSAAVPKAAAPAKAAKPAKEAPATAKAAAPKPKVDDAYRPPPPPPGTDPFARQLEGPAKN